jgi:hypothetical protein
MYFITKKVCKTHRKYSNGALLQYSITCPYYVTGHSGNIFDVALSVKRESRKTGILRKQMTTSSLHIEVALD